MKISELIDSLKKRDLVLPEFQREYVWTKEQAKQLIISLVKDYPVGSLLFWKTDEPPELKNIDSLPEKLGRIQVILDGQQRLTTLYMLITNEIPPFYLEKDIKYDPRDLYFNIETGEFQYYQPSRMKDKQIWISVVNCFKENINTISIARELTNTDSEAMDLAEKLMENVTKLKNILNKNLPEQNVPIHASIKDAIDIFDRVNSQGTKLTDAELALTHITGKWAHARRIMKSKIDELGEKHYYVDLNLMTRALTGIVANRALFPTIHDKTETELKQGWEKLTKISDYIVSTLPVKAFINSTYDLNSTNLLIPLYVYLSLNDCRFPTDKAMKNAIHWLYAGQTWARYSSQTDQRLEHDISLVVRENNPWEKLRDQIIDQRGRINLKANDLEGRGVQHPFYRITYILAKAHGAVDWFNGTPLGVTHGKAYYIHNHHIFSQSQLYKSRFDPDNHLHRKIVNEIANRAILTAETNKEISNKLPEEYLPKVEEKYPGALSKQFIPMDPNLWKLEKYSEFLDARREIIARKYNEFLESLIAEPEVMHERPLNELITFGESATLEFKSTLQWDIVQNRVNKELRHSILKTVVAFLNTEGGTLVIGVEDDGNIIGLEKDLKVSGNSIDKFQQKLNSLIFEHIGAQYSIFVKIRFENLNGRQVCVIDTSKAPEPVFLKMRGSEFFVRIGCTSRSLDPEGTVKFIALNWE